MQKIIPHLWFDKEARAAAEFYVSIFDDAKIIRSATLHDTPSGTVDMLSFTIAGYRFAAISAGPFFKINPSISFFLNFDPSKDKDARAKLDALWTKLSDGGTARMPLQEYPFSKRYGWVEDRFGVNWQLILNTPGGEARPFIVPSLMFTKGVAGKAEAAIDLYVSVFNDAKKGMTARYPAGSGSDEGTLMYSDFMLEGQWFAAMDSAGKHDFAFNEAVSLMVNCETQEEVDAYWSKLSAVPEAEQCGWLKDKFGVSWQIVPTAMDEMMSNGTPEQVARVTQAFLKMKKFDIAALRAAYEGK